MSTTTVIEMQDNIVTVEEQLIHPNGRVIIRRLLTPSDEWLRHVLPALNDNDMLDSMGLSNLPERLLNHLVERFAHEIPPSAAEPSPTLTIEHYNTLRRRCVKKKNNVLGKFQEETCAICLAEWKLRESVTTLPCGHEFHHRCVVKWLTKNQAKCPVCRRSVE